MYGSEKLHLTDQKIQMATSSEKVYRDYQLGNFQGNLFALLADKFPLDVRRKILDTYRVNVDCRINIRASVTTSAFGYFISYPKDKFIEIQQVLDEIFNDTHKTPNYPGAYNILKADGYPGISHQSAGDLVVWFS